MLLDKQSKEIKLSGWRPHIESLRCLNVGRMVRTRALIPGTETRGAWAWTREGERVASIGYEATWHGPGFGSLRLQYTITQDGERLEKDYCIRLIGRPLRFGGFRWYSACPVTGRPVLKLYMVQGTFVARTAIRPLPTYASQRAGRGLDRIIERRWALRRKLGDPGDLFCELTKPKWMRWRTFQRYADLDDRLAEAEDGAFLGRVGRLMGVGN